MQKTKHPAGKKSWLVHGPQGCGKTTSAQRIADALQLNVIIDDWQPGDPAPITDCLILTSTDGPWPPFTRRTMSFDDAMKLANQNN